MSGGVRSGGLASSGLGSGGLGSGGGTGPAGGREGRGGARRVRGRAGGGRGHGAGSGPGDGHGGGGGGHDGAGSTRWLLTYADLITLLLAFFVVMYAMSEVNAARYQALAASLRAAFATAGETLIDTEGISPDARKVLDGLNRDTGQPYPPALPPAGSPEAPGEGSGEPSGEWPGLPGLPSPGQGAGTAVPPMSAEERERMEGLVERVNEALREAGLGGRASARLTERGVAIIFDDQVFFDLGRAELRPEGRDLLRRLAPILAQVPGTILVEGHTDNLPIRSGRYPSNWELSTARATTVVRYLAEQAGLDPRRLAAAGYGEWRPRYPNTSAANRARNRRVEIVLLRPSLDPTARIGEGAGGGTGP
ncbi:flagellar motor protein MotB [Thermaerobacter subterraneus]|uniref:Flagellar motor protein n=1 Tax=Thermaerobacter subterraneus DSM 13965 TaxID=867903 RepID=K6QCB2_9FIRM|nr:flagellar motor protein MotB [Thermaerobacter subterraneus]EKP94126.1 flagellar motor protein [Thermaerobacter subterraneus DSM 13965]